MNAQNLMKTLVRAENAVRNTINKCNLVEAKIIAMESDHSVVELPDGRQVNSAPITLPGIKVGDYISVNLGDKPPVTNVQLERVGRAAVAGTFALLAGIGSVAGLTLVKSVDLVGTVAKGLAGAAIVAYEGAATAYRTNDGLPKQVPADDSTSHDVVD